MTVTKMLMRNEICRACPRNAASVNLSAFRAGEDSPFHLPIRTSTPHEFAMHIVVSDFHGTRISDEVKITCLSTKSIRVKALLVSRVRNAV